MQVTSTNKSGINDSYSPNLPDLIFNFADQQPDVASINYNDGKNISEVNGKF